MKLNFKDINLALIYLQIKLKEQYNPNILIPGDYYITSNNNYGFAHFIARYLNTMYPPLKMYTGDLSEDIDDSYRSDLQDEVFESTKSLTDTISIANYFMCDNEGNKLVNDLIPDNDKESTSTYRNIYGTDICAIFDVMDSPLFVSVDDLTAEDEHGQPVIKSDYLKPLLDKIRDFNQTEHINEVAKSDRIYNLYTWDTDKQICEIDDLVLSYLLGRTITPTSSAEDIYYVQRLFYGEYVPEIDKGVWTSDYGNLTDTIKEYQKLHTNPILTNPLFVTGYFDIFTEASILRDRGEQVNGLYGL